MTTNYNYQQMNLKTKTKAKQTTRTQKWRSHGGLSVGEWEEE